MKKNKILLIRFSSIGDVTQTLSVASRLSELGEVHWATRIDMARLLVDHPKITKVWPLERRLGFWGLLQLLGDLRKHRFTHIYDAHNNMRSHLVCWALHPVLNPSTFFEFPWPRVLRKSQKRWKRFLLFTLRKNTYQMPFSGQRDLLEPLTAWGLSQELPPTPQIFPSDKDSKTVSVFLEKLGWTGFIALVPSAAYPLKRWPIENWKKLIELMPEKNFAILGSLHDRFLSDLVSVAPDRVFNFAGRLDLMESAALIKMAEATVSNDTGPLHFAEQLGKPTVALMGPAPFGFPSRPSTVVLERDLPCRPCSKHGQGPCTNKIFHQCLVDIKTEEVVRNLKLLC